MNVARYTAQTSFYSENQSFSSGAKFLLQKNRNVSSNAGDQQTLAHSFQATDYLLQREYANKYLYEGEPGEPLFILFISPFFLSTNMYYDDVPMLKEEIERTFKNVYVNDPNSRDKKVPCKSKT